MVNSVQWAQRIETLALIAAGVRLGPIKWGVLSGQRAGQKRTVIHFSLAPDRSQEVVAGCK
jgi:hypothetical protein